MGQNYSGQKVGGGSLFPPIPPPPKMTAEEAAERRALEGRRAYETLRLLGKTQGLAEHDIAREAQETGASYSELLEKYAKPK